MCLLNTEFRRWVAKVVKEDGLRTNLVSSRDKITVNQCHNFAVNHESRIQVRLEQDWSIPTEAALKSEMSK